MSSVETLEISSVETEDISSASTEEMYTCLLLYAFVVLCSAPKWIQIPGNFICSHWVNGHQLMGECAAGCHVLYHTEIQLQHLASKWLRSQM